MKRGLFFLILLFLFFSCTSKDKEKEKLTPGKSYSEVIEGLRKNDKGAFIEISEVGNIRVKDYNLPVFVEKKDLVSKENELYLRIAGEGYEPVSKIPFSSLYIKVNDRLFKAEYGIRNNPSRGANTGFECFIPYDAFGSFPFQISVIGIDSNNGYYENSNLLWISVVEKNVFSFGDLGIYHGSSFNLDYINDIPIKGIKEKISFSNQDYLCFVGWAFDSLYTDLAGGVYIVIDNTNYFRALYGLKRVDVADYFNTPQYMYSGFMGYVPVKVIGKGKHSFKIYVLKSDYGAYDVGEYNFYIEIF